MKQKTKRKSVPLAEFARGGKTTKKTYGKSIFSLAAKIRHEKNPKVVAKLRKQIAALVASKKAVKKKK